MIIVPNDERSGGYECRGFGCYSRRTTSSCHSEIVRHDDWFWIVTANIETEYREVLARPKFKIPAPLQRSFRTFIEKVTIRVQPATSFSFPRDPKDELFIAAALASDADYLITGDKDLLDEQPLASTQIVSPGRVCPTVPNCLVSVAIAV